MKLGTESEGVPFEVRTTDEDVIYDNLRGRVHCDKDSDLVESWVDDGLISEDGTEITEEGWDQLNDDFSQVERNIMDWLDEVFEQSSQSGHERFGGLVGSIQVDLNDPEQLERLRGEVISGESIVRGHQVNANWERFYEDTHSIGRHLIDWEISYFLSDNEIVEEQFEEFILDRA